MNSSRLNHTQYTDIKKYLKYTVENVQGFASFDKKKGKLE